jgi:hypothetical protein
MGANCVRKTSKTNLQDNLQWRRESDGVAVLTSRNEMNVPDQSCQIEVFEAGLVVKHADGHWVSYTRPAEATAQLAEQSRHRNADTDASFDRFLREAEIMAHRAALRLNWVEVESAA